MDISKEELTQLFVNAILEAYYKILEKKIDAFQKLTKFDAPALS